MTSTERLYFDDPYLTRFTARVVARAERSGRPAVALDRTAFYPEGGGQPADRGALNGTAVVDVQADDDVVWHLLAADLQVSQVAGELDWPRRFDHMQQHHGQHLLSAAFEELFRWPTLAFHLGVEYATIDLPGEVSEEQARRAEDRANQVIWEDRPVHARFVSPAELAAIPLRKPPAVSGAVRVVSVPDFDHSACGGTHPRSTGAVGILHVRRRERRGGGAETRIEFVCGGRALRDLRLRGDMLGRLAAESSVGLEEVEDAVRRLREQAAASRKRLALVTGRLLEYEAQALVAAARTGSAAPVVSDLRDDLTVDELRMLATAIARAGGVAVLGVPGAKPQVLLARPQDHPLDCGRALREVVGPLGGRGGGQPALAQGGLPDPGLLEQAIRQLCDRARAVRLQP